jgi:hypothetical protein
MSYDLAVWYPDRRLSEDEALARYHALCNKDLGDLTPHPSIGRFYLELYKIHPEVDDVPDEKRDDFDFSPWSIEHDFSDRHMILSCVWSQADHVHDLVIDLAKKHGLAVFDPQLTKIHYPTDNSEKY